jgi:hypothetical protein
MQVNIDKWKCEKCSSEKLPSLVMSYKASAHLPNINSNESYMFFNIEPPEINQVFIVCNNCGFSWDVKHENNIESPTYEPFKYELLMEGTAGIIKENK